MKKRVLVVVFISVTTALALLVAFFPWRLKMVCSGDCPDNGALHVLYRKPYALADCYANHEVPVFLDAWEREYVGCSPLHDALAGGSEVPSWFFSLLD